MPEKLINLTLTEKQAAAVHALYSVGTDIIFARLDPATLSGCAGIISQFELAEAHEMRDKITTLAASISDETLNALGIQRIEA